MLQYVYRLWALHTSLNTDRIFPILNFKAYTPYHTRENVSAVLQVFSSIMIYFCPSTSILFMLQVMSISGIQIRLLICLNWELKDSCSLAPLSE